MRDTAHDGLVEPLHSGVPGRVRLRVAGLHRSPDLQAALECGLATLPGVTSVTASPLTGNLLVQFDPALASLGGVLDRTAALVCGGIPPTPPNDTSPGLPDWHARNAAETAAALGTSATAGLSSRTAEERLAREGANVLEQPPQRSRLEVLLEQFRSLPVGLLAGAAVLSVATGGLLEAAAILAVVGLNGAIGYGVERRSERTISGLGTAADQTAWVVRDGTPAEVGLDAVVPGDLLRLRRGTLVAADARIVSARDLTVSEAMLTGESLPVAKTAEPLPPGAVPLGDRTNMVYRGTVVTGGSGTAIAAATGARTEVGRVQRLLGETATPETPMQRQLDTMGRQLVWFSLGVCGLVFGIGVLRGFAAAANGPLGHPAGRFGSPGGAAGHRHDHLGIRGREDAPARRARPAARCGRDARLGAGGLLRQDRHPHGEPHVGRGGRLGPL